MCKQCQGYLLKGRENYLLLHPIQWNLQQWQDLLRTPTPILTGWEGKETHVGEISSHEKRHIKSSMFETK